MFSTQPLRYTETRTAACAAPGCTVPVRHSQVMCTACAGVIDAHAAVEQAAARARESAERYRALCEQTSAWSTGEHRAAIARLLATAQLWRAAAARARQVGDPRADDWDWAAGSVAGLAELHELDDHLDQIAHEIGLSGGAQA